MADLRLAARKELLAPAARRAKRGDVGLSDRLQPLKIGGVEAVQTARLERNDERVVGEAHHRRRTVRHGHGRRCRRRRHRTRARAVDRPAAAQPAAQTRACGAYPPCGRCGGVTALARPHRRVRVRPGGADPLQVGQRRGAAARA